MEENLESLDSLITIRFRDKSSVSSGRCLKSACSLSTECVVQNVGRPK